MAVTNRLVRETPVRLVRDTCTAHEKHLHGSRRTLARLGQPSRPSFFKTSTIKKTSEKTENACIFQAKALLLPPHPTKGYTGLVAQLVRATDS